MNTTDSGALNWLTLPQHVSVHIKLKIVASITLACVLMVRTSIKKVIKAIDIKDAEAAKAAYQAAVPVIDRMADKGIIHKNKAARHKSRLNAQVKALVVA